MPFYEYRCKDGCGEKQTVVKRISEIDRVESCESCGAFMDKGCRLISKGFFVGEKVEDSEYNPGLGCITHGKRHRREIAKQKGLVEVGNDYESPESMIKEYEQKRADKRKARWDSV